MKQEMKQLFYFVVLLAIVGIAGFLYRATLEAPVRNTNTEVTECTTEARVCPDGTSVGRTGVSCQFAACAFPNIEIPSAGLSFAVPAGYRADENAYGSDMSLLGAFEKTGLNGTTTQPDSIIVRQYAIPEGKDANSVMLSNTTFETSGLQPESMNDFTPVIINGRTYQMIGVERFEGMIRVVYYLPREKTVLRFEATQHNVLEWTDPALNMRSVRAVAALETMLGTVQSN
jgi:hypothetical protein